jgi:hypothetical protein
VGQAAAGSCAGAKAADCGLRAQVPGCLEGQDPEDAPPSRYSVRYRLCATHLYADSLRLTPVRVPMQALPFARRGTTER